MEQSLEFSEGKINTRNLHLAKLFSMERQLSTKQGNIVIISLFFFPPTNPSSNSMDTLLPVNKLLSQQSIHPLTPIPITTYILQKLMVCKSLAIKGKTIGDCVNSQGNLIPALLILLPECLHQYKKRQSGTFCFSCQTTPFSFGYYRTKADSRVQVLGLLC